MINAVSRAAYLAAKARITTLEAALKKRRLAIRQAVSGQRELLEADAEALCGQIAELKEKVTSWEQMDPTVIRWAHGNRTDRP